MSFDSVVFWLLFAVAWPTWRLLPFHHAKSSALLLSLVFYGWWNPWYLSLILASTIVDYRVGGRIHAATERRTRRRWLLVSLGANLGLLAVFKYAPFAARNLSALGGWLGHDPGWRLAEWIVPVGISFYTFQTLSYSLDVYRGRMEPTKSFRDFFLYVAFFPQLVAGPIVRAQEFLPQIVRRRRLLPVAVQTGLYHVVVGLFLKLVVADNVGARANALLDAATIADRTPVEAWLGIVYFGVQIFADFAGYSGIAIGLAYLMGLRFPRNFNYPYISAGLSEFWTRWHITLSGWLRDYLYISLGGNRRGPTRTYVNLMVTMLLGGLWHGASWTFVAWGCLHGLGLCVERLVRGERPRGDSRRPRNVPDLLARLARIALVFTFVHTAWVFFRAPSFGVAWTILERMYVAPFRSDLGFEHVLDERHLVLLAPVAAAHLAQLAHEWCGFRKRAWLRAVWSGLLLLAIVAVRREQSLQFLYFQF